MTQPKPGSLDAYMQAQKDAAEGQTTTRIPVPRFPAIAVELRPLDHKREFKIGKTNEKLVRNEADRLLYIMADVIVGATVGFFLGVGDEAPALEGADASWNALCRKAYPESVELTTRQALIRLVTSDGVGRLYREYTEWRESRGEDVADELALDLGGTH